MPACYFAGIFVLTKIESIEKQCIKKDKIIENKTSCFFPKTLLLPSSGRNELVLGGQIWGSQGKGSALSSWLDMAWSWGPLPTGLDPSVRCWHTGHSLTPWEGEARDRVSCPCLLLWWKGIKSTSQVGTVLGEEILGACGNLGASHHPPHFLSSVLHSVTLCGVQQVVGDTYANETRRLTPPQGDEQHLLCGAREGCMEKRTTDMDLRGGWRGSWWYRETEFRNQGEAKGAMKSQEWLNAC